MKGKFLCIVVVTSALAVGCPLATTAADADQTRLTQAEARANKVDAQAQWELSTYYTSGVIVPRDSKKAFKWCRKAAEQGLAPAEYRLGLDFANGEGVKPDQREATRWLRKAAEQDFPAAEVELGLRYTNGEGAPENHGEAVSWFRKAAGHGDPFAEYHLGNCYLEGTGVTKDTDEAVRWIRQAADRGLPMAQNAMGGFYEKGVGVPKDNVQAYKWYNLAAAQDDQRAVDIRVSIARVETLLTPDQVTEAQRLSREFKPRAPGQRSQGAAVAQKESGKESTSNQTGSVNITSSDDGSEIYVDGSFMGNAPAKLQMSPGAHQIEVKKPGMSDYARKITVTPGSELTLRAVLEK